MSNSVLIVEKDLQLMQELRDGLMARGFEVEETTDGKGTPELVRRNRPGCVVLAVDLDAGQNGYIICKKLKSDDDLKTVPVIIIGDPKGFAKHQQLKTRAEEYVGKPMSADQLIDAVGSLIGFPQPLPITDEGFNPDAILARATLELEIDSISEPTADLAMVDSMFSGSSPTPGPMALADDLSTAPPALGEAEQLSDRTVVGIGPASWSAGPRSPPFQSSPSSIDAAETREMRAKVTELTGALEESRGHAEGLEGRIRELEVELETKATELETARAAPGRSDSKEVFALRDAANKKDKEILRLKNEFNAKEQEIVELREKENTLEQQLSEMSGELSAKDTTIKTSQTKADQLAVEKKKADQQLLTAKEEARASSARLQTLQTDYDALIVRVPELEGQLEELRASLHDEQSAHQAAATDLAEVRGEFEAMKSLLEERLRELDNLNAQLDNLNAQLDQSRSELDSSQAQLSAQATSFAEEVAAVRARLGEAEAQASRAQDTAERTQGRVNALQDQLDRLRGQLRQAMDTLGESPAESEDLDIDEIAEA